MQNGVPALLTLGFNVRIAKSGTCYQRKVILPFFLTNGKLQEKVDDYSLIGWMIGYGKSKCVEGGEESLETALVSVNKATRTVPQIVMKSHFKSRTFKSNFQCKLIDVETKNIATMTVSLKFDPNISIGILLHSLNSFRLDEQAFGNLLELSLVI